MARLSERDLAAGLATRPGWRSGDNAITKTFIFGDFVAAMAFVNRMAELAEAAGHHPDIDIRYNRVIVGLTTHDQGGVTEKDLELAGQIDGVA